MSVNVKTPDQSAVPETLNVSITNPVSLEISMVISKFPSRLSDLVAGASITYALPILTVKSLLFAVGNTLLKPIAGIMPPLYQVRTVPLTVKVLYFVTSIVKSNSWALTVFPFDCTLNGFVVALPNAEYIPRSYWSTPFLTITEGFLLPPSWIYFIIFSTTLSTEM